MYILNYILLIAIGLFAISMLFICLGLLLNPKKPKVQEESLEYDMLPAQEIFDTEDTDDAENAEDEDELSGDEESDGGEDEDKSGESDNTQNSGDGVELTVTVIDTGKEYDVTVSDDILIGRNPQCDVVVPQPMVSSVHCVLVLEGKKVMAEDNDSTNGTLLNGKPLKHMVEIKNNDVLTLGDRLIRINFKES